LPAFAQTSPNISTNQVQSKPQTGSLSGQIVDAKNKPVSYATVTLLSADSVVISGDLTKEDGSFAISPTGTGSFILRINIIGFRQRYVSGITISQESPEKKMGRVQITAEAHTLEEVSVTGEKNVMELSVDKKVFNVEKNLTSAGGSAADALKNVPSLSVDVDGDVQLRGKQATILIDGKPATLFGGDVASALQSLPAASIQSVEVITNPSAKFDAQGMSGIVNIITKKENRFGINGTATVGAGTRDKYNGSLNLNLRNDKWNVFFNTSYRSNKNYQRTRNERYNLDGTLISASYEDNRRLHGGFFTTAGAEYTFDERNALTLTQNINLMKWGNKGNTTFRFYEDDILQTYQVRSSDNLGGPLSSSTSLDYKHKFLKPKQEISTNITFAKTNVTRDQEFITGYYTPAGSPIGNQIIQQAPGGGSSTSLNGQADFTTPFLTKDGKLDAGWKTQLYWFESSNEAMIDRGLGDGFERDSVLQNDFNYSQHIHAAYASYSDQKGKFGYQFGLRGELSSYKGTSSLLTTGSGEYTNEFLSLFPSAYLSYKLPQEQAVYLSYTRRTNRPHFFQMMPYLDVSNPMDTSAGNPDLIPEFIHNTELNWSRQYKKGHTLIASTYLQYTQNLIDRIRRFNDDSSGISFSMPQNLNYGLTYGVELTGRFQILPSWDASLNFNFFKNDIMGSNLDAALNNSGTSWFTKVNTNVKLPANFSLQVSGNYDAPKVAAQGEVSEVYFIDVALRKSFWKNKANVVLNVSDIFNTRKYTTTYDFAYATQQIYRDRETRVGNISFTYRFGKSEVKQSGRRREAGQGSVKERDNIKQGDNDGGF
ncbi:MAG: TonB-dependent receptor, partial [Sphingobacteriales bacterium]